MKPVAGQDTYDAPLQRHSDEGVVLRFGSGGSSFQVGSTCRIEKGKYSRLPFGDRRLFQTEQLPGAVAEQLDHPFHRELGQARPEDGVNGLQAAHSGPGIFELYRLAVELL